MYIICNNIIELLMCIVVYITTERLIGGGKPRQI